MKTAEILVQERKDRLIHEHIHDPYKIRGKLLDRTVCPECRALFHEGRWQWTESWPVDAHQQLCQACHRIKDGYPAGVVNISGDFAQAHRDEIVHMVKHLGEEEKRQHPLHRIMAIERHPERLVITTTDIHLPHHIGHALHDAFDGELDYRYEKETYFIRVNWKREDGYKK